MMVIESNNPWRPLFGFFTPSKRCSNISGFNKLPTPNERAADRINLSRLVKRTSASTRIPDAATLAKRKVVTPPSTEFGMARKTPEIFPKMPKRMRKKQHHRPAPRFAHRVIAMTPLFCANIDRGVTVKRAEKKPPIPSLRIPPWIRESKRSPTTSCRETSADAVMSPMASMARETGKQG